MAGRAICKRNCPCGSVGTWGSCVGLGGGCPVLFPALSQHLSRMGTQAASRALHGKNSKAASYRK